MQLSSIPMTKSLQLVLKEFREKFTDKWSNGVAVVYPIKEGVSNIIPAEDMEKWLIHSITDILEGEGSRIITRGAIDFHEWREYVDKHYKDGRKNKQSRAIDTYPIWLENKQKAHLAEVVQLIRENK